MILSLSFLPILVLGKRIVRHAVDGIEYYPSITSIQKNPLDPREYQGLKLNNRLKVLLISDPKAKKSTVSLGISSGGLDDPDNVPGLAHFIEHMVIQGSRKYPEAYNFTGFLDSNGGGRSALTGFEETFYFYRVGNWALEESLDIFVDFFVEPLFNETVALGEGSAIDYEYKLNKKYSPLALIQILADRLNCSREVNPHNGNNDTLIAEPLKRGESIREMISSYYRQHYSSNLMSLVISGNEDIETLKRMVVPRFSSIPDRNLTANQNGFHGKGTDLGLDIAVDPGNETKDIIIRFLLDTPTMYRLEPQLKYVASLLESKGKGSFKEILKSNNLAKKFAISLIRLAESTLFDFTFSIDERAQPNKHELIKVFFAYLNAIRTQGANHERFKNFFLQERDSYLAGYSSVMQFLEFTTKLCSGADFDTILGYSNVIPVFTDHLLQETTSLFDTTNFVLFDVRPFNGSLTTEPWFGLNYSSSHFNKSFLAGVSSVTAEDYGIHLPEDQPIEIKEPTKYEAFMPEVFLLANNSIGYAKTFTVDTKGSYYFELEFTFDHNPSPSILTYLDLFKEIFDATYSQAIDSLNISSIRSSVKIHDRSISLVLEDEREFSHATLCFANLIRDYFPTPKSFESSKEKVLKSLYIDKSDYLAKYTSLLGKLADPYYRNNIQQAREINATSFEEFKLFIDSFHDSLRFNVIGSNMTSAEALVTIKAQLEEIFNLDPNNAPSLPVTPIPFSVKGNFVWVEPVLKEHSSISYYLHLYDSEEVENTAMALVTNALFSSRFLFQLRTIDRLGYAVKAELSEKIRRGGIHASITSDQPGTYLESRIEVFLEYFVDQVRNMSQAYLNRTLNSMVKVQTLALQETPSRSYNAWHMIRAQIISEEQKHRVIEFLPSISKDALLSFLEARLLKSSPDRLKLSVHSNPRYPGKHHASTYTIEDCGTLLIGKP
ncbi:hypothetical protein DSO57_1025203 [Entomophthora muscae]|uniref:Uncharacterized protein n=1 Tax=Entomophthora muscae TaxID=34485 RepID=A0ACC2RH29_9FUNG|nr:hypothetical protein DSO57_1025203 [Entomophthora muscae]